MDLHDMLQSMTIEDANPIAEFFQGYDYRYTRRRETMAQFWDMCDSFGWNRDDQERDDALAGIRNAIAKQFNTFYGADLDDHENWKKLFSALQISDVPNNVEKCRDKIQSIHVNICDLVDFSLNSSGDPPRLFATSQDLAEYSRRQGKIYPKENAYAEGLLRFLLREIFGVYHGHNQGRRGRGNRGSGRRGPRGRGRRGN